MYLSQCPKEQKDKSSQYGMTSLTGTGHDDISNGHYRTFTKTDNEGSQSQSAQILKDENHWALVA
jgi:hypothetical protein